MRRDTCLLFVFCLTSTYGFESICKKDICFGTTNQIILSHGKGSTFFLRPDDLVIDQRSALEKLTRGEKLICNDTTTSNLEEDYPLILSHGISLLPSCQEKQKIRRISKPSESTHLSVSVYADIIKEENFAPCSILKVTCGSKSFLSDFHLDNQDCLRFFGEKKLPSFVKAAININILSGCNRTYMSNLSGEHPFVIHVRSMEETKSRKHLTIKNIHGHVIFDEIHNNADVIDVTTVSFNAPMNVTDWTCHNLIDVTDYYGLENVILNRKGLGDNSCKFHVFVHLFFHVTLGFLSFILFLCCCWQSLEKEKNVMLKNKKE